MVLSIIIPYYNGGKYTEELLDCLDPQVTDDVEVILVDDGSPEPFKTGYKWCKVIRKKNGGCASARNRGLEEAKGNYIAFIDADDMVPSYFVEKLFEKMLGNYDIIDFSWKSLDNQGNQHNYVLYFDSDRLPNPSVCTRVFKRSFIGNIRFNEKKDSTEDEDFSRKIGYLYRTDYKHGSITEYMYFYRTSLENSKVKRFKLGLMKTKRIVYYHRYVTSDMTKLLEEIKREDEQNEVWLLTDRCDIPEMKRYCQIHKPIRMWAHYLRGEHTDFVAIIPPPIRAQVILYAEYCGVVGGITTFIYNFCYFMRKYYDIMVVFEKMDPVHIRRLSELVKIEQYDKNQSFACETLILNRLTDKIYQNILHRQSIQICHACRQINYRIPKDRDILINVSQAAKNSWGEESADGLIVHNFAYVKKEKCLFLVSATRTKTIDKGENDNRMKQLAEKLTAEGIKFFWLNFADKALDNMPKGFVDMPSMPDIHAFIAKADYLVQLSDKEAYSMSILEALCLNTAVICTPFPSAVEEGVKDGENGYIVPYNMDFDVKKLLKVPKFRYKYNNDEIIEQWRGLIGEKTMPIQKPKNTGNIICQKKYYDTVLKKTIYPGDRITVSEDRAELICNMGYARRG
ncbi:MAG: glycosyltransferase [Clostridia bacterium]|nr:glycosyltransferase [Clostridia bacterium]